MIEANQQSTAKQEIPESTLLHGNPWQPTAMWGITWMILMILFGLGLWNKRKSPGRIQNACEFFYEWLEKNTLEIVGDSGMEYFPLYASIFIYVFFNNLLGLFPYLSSATASSNTTIALATVTALATHVLGVKKRGMGHYVLHYFQVVDFRKGQNLLEKLLLFPMQFLLLPVIEVVGTLAQPVSLAARLFGKIFGKETILAVLAAMLVTLVHSPSLMNHILAFLPLVLRPGIIVLGVLVSLIQAVVFAVLSMVYISTAVGGHHEDHEASPVGTH